MQLDVSRVNILHKIVYFYAQHILNHSATQKEIQSMIFFNSQFLLGGSHCDFSPGLSKNIATPQLCTNFCVCMLQKVFTRSLVMMLSFMVCSQRQ